ncbi:MAG: DNA alkylation repair protein [Bacteroidales bacterium]|nr:DNA alkylation repair protein [Bacteroidales bacterium]
MSKCDMDIKTPEYLQPLKQAFRENAHPGNALQMKKYMKGRYDFFGIKSPLRKEIYREHKSNYGLIPSAKEEEIVQWCWQQAEREYQYFAMEFLNKPAKKADEKIIDVYVYLITHKSWWDTVDFIAANLVGKYLERFPEKTEALTSAWMASGDMWLQRTCLLFQLKYKTETNTELLHQFISPLSASNEFFIRKAIGWILREYSKTNPQFVIDYVEKHPLSGLSQREALKWLKR